jgi:hypothetical protein
MRMAEGPAGTATWKLLGPFDAASAGTTSTHRVIATSKIPPGHLEPHNLAWIAMANFNPHGLTTKFTHFLVKATSGILCAIDLIQLKHTTA